MRWGYFRWGVYRPELWHNLLKQFEGVASCDVTRRKLVLSPTRDSTTGWRKQLDRTESTIEGVLIPRVAQHLALSAGTYVKLDALFFTADGLEVGDEIKTANNVYYEVKTVKPHPLGDTFYFRECQLTELSLER